MQIPGHHLAKPLKTATCRYLGNQYICRVRIFSPLWILTFLWVLGFTQVAGHNSLDLHTPADVFYTAWFQAGDTITLISHSTGDTLNGRISERIDLNADNEDELIVFLDGCGNWGHCIYAILTPKGENTYRQLWAEYLYKYTIMNESPVDSNGQSWKSIVLFDRNDYGGNPPALMVYARLQYRDGQYVESPTAPYPIASLPHHIHHDFAIQASITVSGKTYQLGRSIAPGWDVVCLMGVCHYVPTNGDHRQYHLSEYPKAPIVLRVIEHGFVEDFALDAYEDIDQYTMQLASDGHSLLIQGRYTISAFDTQTKRHSPAVIPGRDVDYREDAISGSLAGLTFFDGNRYVLGHAQGYGLFCFDFSDMDKPTELTRYYQGEENRGQPHLFVGQNRDGCWFGILANSDPQSAVPTIRAQYKKVERAVMIFQNLTLAKPIEPIDHFLILQVIQHDQSTALLIVDFQSGMKFYGEEADGVLEKLTSNKKGTSITSSHRGIH